MENDLENPLYEAAIPHINLVISSKMQQTKTSNEDKEIECGNPNIKEKTAFSLVVLNGIVKNIRNMNNERNGITNVNT